MNDFARPGLLALVLLLPLTLAAAFALYVLRRRSVAAALGDAALVRRLTGGDLYTVPRARAALLLLAAGALGVAAAGPRWGAEDEGSGLELVLVLDASNSMLAADVAPNRLERQREAARALVRGLDAARVGIVVFAGRGYILSPLTADAGALELYLETLGPDIATQGGSSLASALRQGSNLLLGGQPDRSRALVLISDGEALEERDEVLRAARAARRAGVTVHTLGVGTAGGARVPEIDPATGERTGWKTDPETGRTVVSRLDADLLRRVARITGGRSDVLEDGALPLPLLRTLAARQGGAAGAGTRGSGERPEPWIAAALLLLAAETWRERRTHPGAAAALALLGLAAGCTPAGDAAAARGEWERATAAYAERVERGDSSARLRFNLGTALLHTGRWEDARGSLEAAAQRDDPAVRSSAFFNGGGADLHPAWAAEIPADGRREALVRAIVAYRRALLVDPGDADAKWNLELAQQLLAEDRRSESPPEPQGGRGGGGDDPAPAQPDPQPSPGARGGPRPELSPAEAERILAGAAEQEEEVQRGVLRRERGGRRGVRDW